MPANGASIVWSPGAGLARGARCACAPSSCARASATCWRACSACASGIDLVATSASRAPQVVLARCARLASAARACASACAHLRARARRVEDRERLPSLTLSPTATFDAHEPAAELEPDVRVAPRLERAGQLHARPPHRRRRGATVCAGALLLQRGLRGHALGGDLLASSWTPASRARRSAPKRPTREERARRAPRAARASAPAGFPIVFGGHVHRCHLVLGAGTRARGVPFS